MQEDHMDNLHFEMEPFKVKWLVLYDIIRDEEAIGNDNAFFLFKWIRKNKPEFPCFYVVNSDKDYAAVALRQYGNLIIKGSPEHEFLIRHPQTLCASSHYIVPGVKHFFFLRHGVNLNDSLNAQYLSISPKLRGLIFSTPREMSFFLEKYPSLQSLSILTGLCRWDFLPRKEYQKTIFLFFTWRRSFQDISQQEFMETDYYLKIQELLQSKNFKNLSDKYGYTIDFMPHHNTEAFINCFQSDFVKILNDKKKIIDCIHNASICITDYSSLHTDFSIVNRPVLFYQFDQEGFRKHMPKAYFDYDEDGFGDVCRTKTALLKSLEKVLDEGMSPVHIKKAKDFFQNIEIGNVCEKTFTHIENMYLIKIPKKKDKNNNQGRIGLVKKLIPRSLKIKLKKIILKNMTI